MNYFLDIKCLCENLFVIDVKRVGSASSFINRRHFTSLMRCEEWVEQYVLQRDWADSDYSLTIDTRTEVQRTLQNVNNILTGE